ncbi:MULTISPECIES: hypothetical protein [Caballeronia]|uniref:hypothetical protein n=1 Tax=Caballeronia TaxID=1827195 RepID=UPI001EF3DADB|nr:MULTISPECIES: hypothetical protein [Caballeronia]MCG7405738.1 hypothetical protein [Caballeronia zhejiangensis]
MTTKPPADSIIQADTALLALEALEELVITVNFDRDDPASVEAAIQTVEASIDTAVAAYRGHPMVESAVAELKAECRAGLYEQAERVDAFIPSMSASPKKPTLH